MRGKLTEELNQKWDSKEGTMGHKDEKGEAMSVEEVLKSASDMYSTVTREWAARFTNGRVAAAEVVQPARVDQKVTPELFEMVKRFSRLLEELRAHEAHAHVHAAMKRLHKQLDSVIEENAAMLTARSRSIERRVEEEKARKQEALVREQVNAELARLRGEVARLQAELHSFNSVRDHSDALNKANSTLRGENEALRKENHQLRHDVTHSAKAHEDAEKRYQALANSWNAWQARLDAGASARELAQVGKDLDKEGAMAWRIATGLLRLAAQEPKKR